MEINQINSKRPEGKTPGFEIIIKSYDKRALKEGVEPERSIPCNGYMLLADQGKNIAVTLHGEIDYVGIAQCLLANDQIGPILKLLALLH